MLGVQRIELGKVAAALSQTRNRQRLHIRRSRAAVFVAGEEKPLVSADRAADHATLPQPDTLGGNTRSQMPIVGVQRRVLVRGERHAMKLIGAALERDI